MAFGPRMVELEPKLAGVFAAKVSTPGAVTVLSAQEGARLKAAEGAFHSANTVLDWVPGERELRRAALEKGGTKAVRSANVVRTPVLPTAEWQHAANPLASRALRRSVGVPADVSAAAALVPAPAAASGEGEPSSAPPSMPKKFKDFQETKNKFPAASLEGLQTFTEFGCPRGTPQETASLID